MEVTDANLSITHPLVAAAKPFPGQIQAAEHLRDVLSGSHLWDESSVHSVQDALPSG